MSTPAPFERLLMHSATTVDYGFVRRAEVTLVLDADEEVPLRRMDTVVENAMVMGGATLRMRSRSWPLSHLGRSLWRIHRLVTRWRDRSCDRG